MIRPIIIVCAYNEQQNVTVLLKAMKAQTYGDFTFYLIDDGSVDATFSKAQSYISEHSLSHFHILKKEHVGKEAAMREAIMSVADGNALILTTDADCQPPATWVECMVNKFEETGAAMLIGPVAIDGSHPFQATEFLSIEAVTLGSAAIGHPLMCGGANLGFRKDAYIKANEYMPQGFDNGGDMYLLEAMKSLKVSISPVVSNSALVVTNGSDSIGGFIRQRTRWAGKAPNYTDWEIIAAGLITVIIQAVFIAFLIGAFYNITLLYVWIAKIIIDFIILTPVAVMQKRARLIPYILPVSLIYPFYTMVILIISTFKR
ncbi:MAG: glycosyltransferase [Paludibacteraceae bacterium]|nr:glycosyltransferase [Paludibacteraceae bacterium]MBO7368335.1 glycosyltransferase [Paludibacteraceae bacterium]